jgi:hypothetical protein
VAVASLVSHHSPAPHIAPPHTTGALPSPPDASGGAAPLVDASPGEDASATPEPSGAHCVAPQTQWTPRHVQKLQPPPPGEGPTHPPSVTASAKPVSATTAES